MILAFILIQTLSSSNCLIIALVGSWYQQSSICTNSLNSGFSTRLMGALVAPINKDSFLAIDAYLCDLWSYNNLLLEISSSVNCCLYFA